MKLVKALLTGTAGGIYATSRTCNKAMHKTLGHLGFTEAGVEYPSIEHPAETLSLFVLRQGPP